MAKMTLTVPDAIGQRIVDAFAVKHGYAATITDEQGNEIPNPQTKFAFMGQVVSAFIVDSVVDAEVWQAQQAAREAARQKGQRDITITVS